MSGGIFPKYPFVLNIKCIIFSLIIMILYSYCPPQHSYQANILIYFMIFVVSYVALAWYDYYYSCSQLPLQRSPWSLTSHFKPPVTDDLKQTQFMMTPEEINKNNKSIYALHLLIIVPLLLYIGVKKNNSNPKVYDTLIALVVFTAIYHSSQLYNLITFI